MGSVLKDPDELTGEQEAEFRYFLPEEKPGIYTPERLALLLWLMTFLLAFLEDAPTDEGAGIWTSLFVISAICFTMYRMIASFFTYKPLKGSFDGTIKFSPKFITVNDTIVDTKKIHSLVL